MAVTQPDFSLTEHLITKILVVFSGGQKKILFHAYYQADVDPTFQVWPQRKVNTGHKTGTQFCYCNYLTGITWNTFNSELPEL